MVLGLLILCCVERCHERGNGRLSRNADDQLRKQQRASGRKKGDKNDKDDEKPIARPVETEVVYVL